MSINISVGEPDVLPRGTRRLAWLAGNRVPSGENTDIIDELFNLTWADRVRVPKNKAGVRTAKRAGAPVSHASPGRESVASLLRDTHRLYAKALSAFIRDANITIMQWLILRALWAENGIT